MFAHRVQQATTHDVIEKHYRCCRISRSNVINVSLPRGENHFTLRISLCGDADIATTVYDKARVNSSNVENVEVWCKWMWTRKWEITRAPLHPIPTKDIRNLIV